MRTTKPWTPNEIQYLEDHYGTTTRQELKNNFSKNFSSRSLKAIERKAENLGLLKQRHLDFGVLYKSEQLKDYIDKCDGLLSHREIAENFGVGVGTVEKCVKYFNIKNNHKHTLTNEQLKQNSKAREARSRSEYNSYKTSGCVVCGFKTPCALDWHHVKPETKKSELGRLWGFKDKTEFTNELKKCVLLCSNHHRMVHNNLLDLSRYVELDKYK